MTLGLTPSQTVGPYLSIGLLRELVTPHARRPGRPARDPSSAAAARRRRRARAGRDGRDLAGERRGPLRASGRRPRRAGARGRASAASAAPARSTAARFELVTVKPGRVPWPDGGLQAPHLEVGVFARGLLKRRRHPHVLPGRGGGERGRPGALAPRRPRQRADADRRRRGRRAALRHPSCRGRPDDILRGVTAFDALFVPAELREAVSGRAWLAAMLEAERALARAGAAAGMVPADVGGGDRAPPAAPTVRLGAAARRGTRRRQPRRATRARARRARRGEHARWVHLGATSQDVLDTAAMLVARDALRLVRGDLERVAAALRGARAAHTATRPMAGRTLLQQAVPTTFGLKAAGWLVGVLDARARLASCAGRPRGPARRRGRDAGRARRRGASRSSALFARELGLAEPTVPWHTNRVRIAELGAALAIAAGVLRQDRARRACCSPRPRSARCSEGGEAGGSSTMPQKRNPVGATLAASRAPRSRAATRPCSSGRSPESTSAAPAAGRPSGRRSRALCLRGGRRSRAGRGARRAGGRTGTDAREPRSHRRARGRRARRARRSPSGVGGPRRERSYGTRRSSGRERAARSQTELASVDTRAHAPDELARCWIRRPISARPVRSSTVRWHATRPRRQHGKETREQRPRRHLREGDGGQACGARRRARRPRDRAHDILHRGIPGAHHALRVGRGLVASGARPPRAEHDHADRARRHGAGARARDARPRRAAKRAHARRDRRGAAPLRRVLRRARRQRRLRDRAARDRRRRRKRDPRRRPLRGADARRALRRRAGGGAARRPRGARRLLRRSSAGRRTEEIEDVWLGCANQAGEDNRNVARFAALLAGLPDSVAGVTVNRLCASVSRRSSAPATP